MSLRIMKRGRGNDVVKEWNRFFYELRSLFRDSTSPRFHPIMVEVWTRQIEQHVVEESDRLKKKGGGQK